MRIDAHKLARPWWKRKPESLVPDEPGLGRKPMRWLSIYNEARWTPLGTFRRD
jgi:hypothetical protein